MGKAFQIKDQEMPYFLTFQVVGWVDVFTRKVHRDLILENLTFCRKEKGLYLYGYVVMSNHLHLVVLQKDGELSVYFKKFTSKKLLNYIHENPVRPGLVVNEGDYLYFKCGKLGRNKWINKSGSLVEQLQSVKNIWVGLDVKK